MTKSRLVSTFDISGANSIVIDYNGGGSTVIALPRAAGAWAGQTVFGWFDDGSTTTGSADFVAMLKDALDNGTAGTFTVDVNGVGSTTTSYADGRAFYSAGANFVFDIDHAGWTLDARIMGFDPDGSDPTSAQFELYSDWVHRYGWYPQDDPNERLIKKARKTDVAITTGRYVDGIDDGTYETIALTFDHVHSALTLEDDADQSWATDMNLTQGDDNCPFETWANDLNGDTTLRWYFYPDQTSATRKGPYIFGENSLLWSFSTDAAVTVDRAGKRFNLPVDGIEPGG